MYRLATLTIGLLLCMACQPGDPFRSPEGGENHAPTAVISGPDSVVEGIQVAFSARSSTDPDDETLTYSWSFGDGGEATSSPEVTHEYGYHGRYRVTLTVADPHGLADTVTHFVTVSNAPPRITTFTVPPPVPVGVPATIELQFSDPGFADSVSAQVDWGDGHHDYVAAGMIAHTYENAGEYFLTAYVTDYQANSIRRSERPIIVYEGYDVIDLGTLGGNGATPMALNDNGEVVGCSTTTTGQSHAFLWSHGTMQDLTPGVVDSSCAHVINNSGIIGGVSQSHDFNFYTVDQVTVWNHGRRTDLGTLCCEGRVSVVAVTEAGEFVASTTDNGHGYQSAIWRNGVRDLLPGLRPSPSYSSARAMNGREQIVGYSWVGEYAGVPAQHPFIWEDGAMRDLALFDGFPCDTSPGQYCAQGIALGINNTGTVIGRITTGTLNGEGVLWSDGGARKLGFEWPVAINDLGDIAGYNQYGGGSGYFWRDGNLVRLGSLGGGGTHVVDMNNASTVVGWSLTIDTVPHVFVWSPGDARLTDLGIGPPRISATGAIAVAINMRGDILGRAVGPCADRVSYPGSCFDWGPSRAILWRAKSNVLSALPLPGDAAGGRR